MHSVSCARFSAFLLLITIIPISGCSPVRSSHPLGGESASAEVASYQKTNVTVAGHSLEEWMTLSVPDRYAARALMSASERLEMWNQLSLEQKLALGETNAAYDALVAGNPGLWPPGSPYSVNQWITKGAAERAALRPTLVGNGIDLWNAMTLEQKNAMTVINQIYNNMQSANLCAPYSDVQYMDVPISFDRSIMNFYFGNDTVVVAKFTVPVDVAPNSFLDATVAEWQGPPTFRLSTISNKPCDFRAIDITGQAGPYNGSGGTTPQIFVDIGPGKPNPVLQPGQSYYLNIRNTYRDENGNWVPSCQENTNCNASVVVVTRKY